MTYNGVAPRAGELVFPAPRLSFACELDPARLADLFADSAVIDAAPPGPLEVSAASPPPRRRH